MRFSPSPQPPARRSKCANVGCAAHERFLILEAERRQAQARARLLNLEVVRRALLLLASLAVLALALLQLLGEPGLVTVGLEIRAR